MVDGKRKLSPRLVHNLEFPFVTLTPAGTPRKTIWQRVEGIVVPSKSESIPPRAQAPRFPTTKAKMEGRSLLGPSVRHASPQRLQVH